MLCNEDQLLPIIQWMAEKVKLSDIIIDSKGGKTVEIVGARLEFDPKQKYFDFGDIRNTSREYCEKEMKWYDSQSLNIHPIMDDIKIWNQVATKDGRINSNYGWIIYSDDNGSQFDNMIQHLREDEASRRGVMIFNRPSIHEEWNKDGMHDFICSLAYQFLIRNNVLIGIYTWRSEDLIFGLTGSDFYFAATIYDRAYDHLKLTYPELKYGKVIWIVNSLHVYERHFKMLEKISNSYLQKGSYRV
jgi:thymidylate synthase